MISSIFKTVPINESSSIEKDMLNSCVEGLNVWVCISPARIFAVNHPLYIDINHWTLKYSYGSSLLGFF